MSDISTFFALNLGMGALSTAQEAEDVISNNIANANTPGYVQETAQIDELNPFPSVPANDALMLNGQLGTGAQVQTIARETNEFVNQQDRTNQGSYQMATTHQDILTQIQGIINEPSSNSLQNALDQFFSSWQTLSSDPSNTAARQSVLAQAQTVAQTFETAADQLANLQSNLSNVVNGQINNLNQYASEVALLNNQIVSVQQFGESPNTLLDQRDQLLDQMASLANISYSDSSNGSVSVSIGSQTLVTSAAGTLQSAASTFSNTASNLSLITSGGIAGNEAGISDLNQLLSTTTVSSSSLGSISMWEQTFANAVSSVQAQGVTQSGASGPPLFTINTSTISTPTSGATPTTYAYLTVPGSLTTGDIAAAASGGGSGDNTNAINMVNLQDQSIYNGGTLDQGVASIASGVGVEAAATTANTNTYNALAQQSSNMRQSVSGVDINEQAANMVKYQNVYSAAAKFVGVFDTMMQTLLDMVP